MITPVSFLIDHHKNAASGLPSSTAKWTLKADEVGQWVAETCSMMSIQVGGVFSGAKCEFEGTNDRNATPLTLHKQFEGDLSFEAPGISTIRDIPRFIRPHIEGGDDETDITIIIYMVP